MALEMEQLRLADDFDGEGDDGDDKTIMDDLPIEVLVLIFKRISMDNYPSLVKVCSLWETVIHKSVGMAIRVGGPKKPTVDQHAGGPEETPPAKKSIFETVEAKKIAEIGISMCKFDEVRNTVLPPFKYPYLLKVLKIRRYLSLNNFIRLMEQNLFRLEKFSISQSTLSGLEVSTVAMKNLRNLKKIEVTGKKRRQRDRYYGHRSDSGQFEAPLLITNFMCLINKDFPGIRSLKAQIPAVYHKDVKVMISILNFLARNKNTLKRLCITYDEHYDLHQRNRSRPKRNQPPYDPVAEQRAFDFGKIKFNNVLEKLCFNFNQHATNHMSILVDGIRDMIKGHTALKSLEFVQALPVSPELNNLELPATLTNLRLDVKRGVNDVQDFDLNLSILLHCCVLQKLKLVTSLRRAKIIGGTSLPKSLEEITISQFKMTTADCEYIIAELPRLRELTCSQIGNGTGLGFNQQSLIKHLSDRIFKKVHIMRGINKPTIALEIPPGNPVATELQRLLLTAPQSLQVSWKPENGNYVVTRGDEDPGLNMHGVQAMEEDDDFEDEEDENADGIEENGGVGPFQLAAQALALGGAGANADVDMEE